MSASNLNIDWERTPDWLKRTIDRLAQGKPEPRDLYWADPGKLMASMRPDDWQRKILSTSHPQLLINCSRQVGKSTVVAALALKEALLVDGSTVLLVSKALRQSVELLRKVKSLYYDVAADKPRKHREFKPKRTRDLWARETQPDYYEGRLLNNNQLSMEFDNGSRILSLPCSEDTIRGFSSISLLIIDEASKTPDQLYHAVRPMLAVPRSMGKAFAKLAVLSTPFGKRGWFWEAWKRMLEHDQAQETPWEVYHVTAHECPRLTSEFLEEEKVEIGERAFAQEYLCEFVDTEDQVFSYDSIQRSFSNDVEPLELW